MTYGSPLRLGWEVLLAEGPRAVRDRWLDRRLDAARRASFPAIPADGVPGLLAQAPPVLDVMAQAPLRRLGGVAHQYLARQDEESAIRPVALLYADGTRRDGRAIHRLELSNGRRRGAVVLTGAAGAGGSAEEAAAIAAAARLAGTRTIHVDGIAGIPLPALLAASEQGLRMILSLHDLALLCPRPHLLAAPHPDTAAAIGAADVCAACLGDAGETAHAEHRALAAELVERCAALVFPSEFLRRRHQAWFPGLRPRTVVITPTGLAQAAPPRRAAPAAPPRRVAFVGSVQPHKGSEVFEEIVRLAARLPDAPAWHVFGGGDRASLRRLRRQPGVTVHGYYRAGSLPARLAAAAIETALLLSIVPEAHGLTLEECLLAGVPVVAFDHGAIAERVRGTGGGRLVPLAAGAAGILAALAEPPPAMPRIAASDSPVPALLELYRESS